MPEEDDVRQRYENDFLDKRRSQRVDRVPYERASIVEGTDTDTLRKPRLHRFDLRLHGIDHLKGVGAVPDDNNTADRFLAALVENAAPELGPDLYSCNVSHVYRRAVHRSEHDVFDVLDRSNQANPAN